MAQRETERWNTCVELLHGKAYALAAGLPGFAFWFLSTWTRFASRCWSLPSLARFFSFSLSRDGPSLAAFRASRSRRSFSLRSALDSNSCQSPSMFASLETTPLVHLLQLGPGVRNG